MKAACSRVDETGKRIEVCVLELGQFPVVHEQCRQFMPSSSQFSDHTGVGRWARAGPLDDWEIQLPEQDVPKLWVGVDVEFHSRSFVNPLLHCLALCLEALFQRREQRQVNRDSSPFHLGQHVDERYLHSVKESGELVGIELRLKYPAQL